MNCQLSGAIICIGGAQKRTGGVASAKYSLIIANGGMIEGMRTLTAWTSGGIYLVIVLITILSFIKVQRS